MIIVVLVCDGCGVERIESDPGGDMHAQAAQVKIAAEARGWMRIHPKRSRPKWYCLVCCRAVEWSASAGEGVRGGGID